MVWKSVAALAAFAAATYLIYTWIDSLPDVATQSAPDIVVSAAAGEELFWGKGTCHVCHRIAERGYALRGPNLGDGENGMLLPLRAVQRADSLGLDGPVAYVVQSIAQPGAFVVPGFKNEMPEVYRAPVRLFPSEIKSIVTYLMSLAGDTLATEIMLPDVLYAGYQSDSSEPDYPTTGDASAGRDLFFDPHGAAACASCHLGLAADGSPKGDSVGPDLTAIASIRRGSHLYLKIVKPDSNIVSGYEQMLLKTKNGRMLVGMIETQDSSMVRLIDSKKQITSVARGQIAALVPQNISIMPGNLTEYLSENELANLLAYLLTLNGSERTEQDSKTKSISPSH